MATVITGAAGFIGRSLVAALAERGDVIAIDRVPPSVPAGAVAVTADLLDGDPDARDGLAAAETVYHLAGCPDVRDARADADTHRYRDNVLATAAVLAAVPPSAHVVMTSSSSVYGGSRPGRPSSEHDRLRPRGGYAASKALAERLCLARGSGRTTVVRPFTVAGPGQRPGMALSRWLAAAVAGRPLRLYGSPERTRDITDVDDVVRALIALADVRAEGVVNLGTGVSHTLGELASAVSRAVGAEIRTEVVPAAGVEVAHTLAGTARLERLIGWVPRTHLDALVARQWAAQRQDEVAAIG
jgi:nucleoside-diphosphate-sugar epimerase